MGWRQPFSDIDDAETPLEPEEVEAGFGLLIDFYVRPRSGSRTPAAASGAAEGRRAGPRE